MKWNQRRNNKRKCRQKQLKSRWELHIKHTQMVAFFWWVRSEEWVLNKMIYPSMHHSGNGILVAREEQENYCIIGQRFNISVRETKTFNIQLTVHENEEKNKLNKKLKSQLNDVCWLDAEFRCSTFTLCVSYFYNQANNCEKDLSKTVKAFVIVTYFLIHSPGFAYVHECTNLIVKSAAHIYPDPEVMLYNQPFSQGAGQIPKTYGLQGHKSTPLSWEESFGIFTW